MYGGVGGEEPRGSPLSRFVIGGNRRTKPNRVPSAQHLIIIFASLASKRTVARKALPISHPLNYLHCPGRAMRRLTGRWECDVRSSQTAIVAT